MRLRVLTEPTSEPVTLAEARLWLGMTDDNDTEQDPEISLCLAAMRRYAEKKTGRRFCDVELELQLDCFPRVIELPVAPLVSLDYLRYINLSGELTTLYDASGSPTVGAAGVLDLDSVSEPARIQPFYGTSWPSIRADFNPVRVGFTAGYGTGGSPENLAAVPAELKLWLRARLATVFENREQIVVGTSVAELPRSIYDALLDPLMLGRRIG
jgi:uncharacterized phiE125 gp8 family phage protein